MNITINIVELASVLADEETQRYFEYSSNKVYEEDEDETTYTEEAQEIFDQYYDKYYSLIENAKS